MNRATSASMSRLRMLRSTTPSSRDFAAAAWIIGCISVPSLSCPNHSSHISRSIALPSPRASSSRW